MKTWQAAFADAFEGIPGAVCPPPTKIELGKLKSAIVARWTGKTEEMHDFIDFTVRNWQLLMERCFSWMRKCPPPTHPSLDFFLRNHDRLRLQWSGRVTENWINDFPVGEQRRFLELTFKRGFSPEKALRTIGEEMAVGRMRGEMERREAEANQKLRTGLLALQQANRVPVYGVHNPHPQSYAAQRQAEAAAREAHPVKPGAIEEFLAFECPEWDDNK